MTETSKRKKYLMWYKVNELFSKGLNKTQIARKLGLHRQTVSKYVGMNENEFLKSQSYDRQYGHKLDGYEKYAVNLLNRWPFLSAPQVHDRLREDFADLPAVNAKTVFNFVNRIRKVYCIPKSEEGSVRQYEKQPETLYGEYAQCDFGERWMDVGAGCGRKKVYFFVMTLRRSRYKYVYISDRPFTTALAVYAHELAFEHFGGVPRKIVYDQDKVLLSDENLGDLALTHGFRALVSECGFTPVFCRKSDPESKGLVENVVKYVKHNFLKGREYPGVDSLNEQCLSWLERTGNGLEHHGTHKVPSAEFAIEREALIPYKGVPTPPVEQMKTHHVRKDNVIAYRGSYYTVPTGTYRGRDTMVYVSERDGRLIIFSVETGKTIASHELSLEKGRLTRNQSHLRDREASLADYADTVRKLLPEDKVADDYLAALRQDKPRYYRDNLAAIARKCRRYKTDTMIAALTLCLENKVLNGAALMQAAENIRLRKKEPVQETEGPSAAIAPGECLTASLSPEKTDINSYNSLFQ